MYAKSVRTNHEQFLRETAADRRELIRVENDEDLTVEARLKRAQEVRGRIAERFDALLESSRGLVETARREYLEVAPAAIQRQAAFQKPERAVAIRQLAEGVPIRELREIAELVRSKNDPAAAHGLRQALLARAENQGEARARLEVRAIIDEVAARGAESRRADLVAAQHALAQLEAGGPEGGGGITDPEAALTAARAAAIVPTGLDDETIALPAAEIERLLDVAGLEKSPPRDPLAA